MSLLPEMGHQSGQVGQLMLTKVPTGIYYDTIRHMRIIINCHEQCKISGSSWPCVNAPPLFRTALSGLSPHIFIKKKKKNPIDLKLCNSSLIIMMKRKSIAKLFWNDSDRLTKYSTYKC